MFSKSTLAVTLPLLVSSAFAGDCVRRYTVQEGDTCNSISAANSVSTYQLATINKGYIDDQCSNLQPGANICLGYENEDCTTTYVVKAKDTCEQINEAHSIDFTTLLANNPQINDNCDNIYVDEVLCVLPEIRVPPSNAGGLGAQTVNHAVPTTATLASEATATASTGGDNNNNNAGSGNNNNDNNNNNNDNSGDDSGDEDDESLPFCDEL
ncbi:hypothetical protein PQX77_005946 [Marasmius sp. AFHP31]|nr:hypothetical protein PQX77_005946 [Marasmius sp. AFHP31]